MLSLMKSCISPSSCCLSAIGTGMPLKQRCKQCGVRGVHTCTCTAQVKHKRDLEEGRAADKSMMSGDVVVKWPACIAHTFTVRICTRVLVSKYLCTEASAPAKVVPQEAQHINPRQARAPSKQQRRLSTTRKHLHLRRRLRPHTLVA